MLAKEEMAFTKEKKKLLCNWTELLINLDFA